MGLREVVGVMGVLAPFAMADTIHVDASQVACPGTGTLADPFCTVQDGVDAALPGDTVLVEPGTYAELVDFLGKAITLASSGGPDVTTIVSPPFPIEGSVVSFITSEGADSVLEGFTLRDGDGTIVEPDTGAGPTTAGGGVVCLGSSPTIRGNIFVSSSASWGGGLYSDGGTPRIEDNLFDDNLGGNRGGGVYLRNGGEFFTRGNTFHDNRGAGQGGGMLVEDSVSVTVLDSVFDANRGGDGIGMYLINVDATVEDSVFTDNMGSESGGAIIWQFGSMTARRNVFSGNNALDGAGMFNGGTASLIEQNYFTGNLGGAYRTFGSAEHTVIDNVFENHYGVRLGNALARRNVFRGSLAEPAVSLSNGAFTDNLVVGGSTGVLLFGSPVIARNTLVDLDVAFDGSGGGVVVESSIVRDTVTLVTGSGVSFVSSNIEGGAPGPGNIDVDPLFVDALNGDYSLQSGSPCIDAGLASDLVCSTDVLGHPRRLDADFDGSVRVDMGAFEFSHIALDATVVGATLTMSTSGTAGLNVVLVAAAAPGLSCVEKFGTFLVDFGVHFELVPVGASPVSFMATLPAAVPPFEFDVQAVAINPISGRGNTSNVVHIVGP